MREFLVPAGAGASEVVEKRSRFLGHVWPVDSEEAARAHIEAVKKQHRDARHNCWCYRLHTGVERYSDDGEPQGTAGVPMLAVFQKAGVTDGVCVVTRYFGGVLLGAGGLVRAYTQSARDALDAAGVGEMRPWTRLVLPCPYALLEQVKLMTAQRGGLVEDVQYTDAAHLTLLFPAGETDPFAAAITELTAGVLAPEPVGQLYRAVPVKG